MHKYRKIIGVLISLADGVYQKKFIEGIERQAYALDYDVLIFSTFINSGSSDEWQIGEHNIYNMINYDLLDGIIIATDTIRLQHSVEKIEKKIKSVFKRPVVSAELGIDGFYNIFTDDVQPIKNIVSHLIEFHKLTDIAFVTGIKGHPHSAKRLEGYYEALVEHNLPIDQSRVYYGDFWYSCGDEIVDKLLSSGRPLPQAIACASDAMAIGISEALKVKGINVPKDIAVTGYDSVPSGVNYHPCITSAVVPSQITGEQAVLYIHSKLNGTAYPNKTRYKSEICIGKSCGCNISLSDRQHELFEDWRDGDLVIDFNSANNYMLEGLLSETSLHKYFGTLDWFSYQLGDFDDLYICLCDNWDNLNENENSDDYRRDGYSEKMLLVLEHEKNTEIPVINTTKRFNLAEMLPNIYKKRDYPTAYIFTPLHFNDRCFGYAAISYGTAAHSYDSSYRMWMRYVNNSMESLRRQRRLKMMYRRMRENAVMDTMTGIYNRNGFNLYADEIFTSAKDNKKKLLVILSDLNRLKYINDTFGHFYGDAAIKAVAKAMKNVCGSDKICFRIGGDEFIILDSGEYELTQIEGIKSEIRRLLSETEKSFCGKYPLDISMGVFYGSVDRLSSIEQAITIADREMFAEKELFKRKLKGK